MANRILGFIGWLGTGLVVASVLVRFGFPAKEQYVPYLAWAGLVCLVAYMAGQWREFIALFSRRQARYGTLASLGVLVVLGILVAVNYIGAKQSKRWDLTTNKVYSLSDQTRNVLAKLDSPLQMLVFAQDTDFQRFKDRLQEYQAISKNVTTDYIDPDKKPAQARQYEVQQYGTVVLTYKGRTERVTSDAEQEITNGVIKVTTGLEKKLYFTQGHGEKDTASADRDGYNAVAAALGRENYRIEKLVVAQQGAVPDDAAVVVIAGPRTDFFPPELDSLKAYLAKGGKLLMQLDPPDKPDSPPLTNLMALAHDWGIDVGSDVVVDVSGMGRLLGTSEAVPVAATYPPHPITERFSYLTAFPLSRSVIPVEGGVNGHVARAFIETSPRSWAETNVAGVLNSTPVQFDEGADNQGPITIASAVSAAVSAASGTTPPATPTIETRVAVVGDSDFAANAGLGIQGNRDLYLNIVGWLSQQENLISIRPREAGDRRLTMTATQQSNVTWLALIVIPACIFGSGIYAWWRRR